MNVLVGVHANKISAQAVAIATVLVVSVTVLVIAFIKAAFAHPDDGKKSESKDAKDSLVVLPSAELAKAITEICTTAAKAIGKGEKG
jgi:hypothetical protein